MHEPTKCLKTDNADDGAEFEFWEELREICLLPEQAAFNQSGKHFFFLSFVILSWATLVPAPPVFFPAIR